MMPRGRNSLNTVLRSLCCVVAAVLSVSPAAAQCLVPPADLISWWSGNLRATDSRGDNDGLVQGHVTFTDGQVAQAFHFDGVDSYIETTDTGLPSGTASRTIDFWLQTTETRQRYLVSYGNGEGRHTLRIGLREGRLMVTQLETNIRSQAMVNDGVFHHIAVVYEGASETYTLYIDGIPDNTGPMPTNTILSGHLIIGADEQAQNAIEAVVDELDVFSRALSADEVQAIFNAGSAGKCKDVSGRVSGMTPVLAICHNLTTGRSVVLSLAEDASPQGDMTEWECAEAGLRIQPGDSIYQQVLGTAN